jgi:CubicO group peptidase (beta-lactamase class C family)
VDPAFRRVGEVFVDCLAGAELGAAVSVVVAGEQMVDLRGGWADRRRTRPWGRDTLCCAFSATKGVAALCALQAVAEEGIDPDQPLAELWPELAGEGREAITLRQVLAHRSGLVGWRPETDMTLEDLYDPQRAAELLAVQRPFWAPGTDHGYQARSYGVLLEEALRRATGHSLATHLRDRISGPLGLDLHLGLGPAEQARCAELTPAPAGGAIPEASRPMLKAMGEPGTPTHAAFSNPPGRRGYMNTEAFRQAELPAMNAHATAPALARLYGMLAAGDQTLLPPSVLAEATSVQSEGPDRVLLQPSCFGLGFQLSRPELVVGLSDAAFGHAGAGGSLAFADPSARVGFCFLMNRMRPGAVTGNDSAMALVDALAECL